MLTAADSTEVAKFNSPAPATASEERRTIVGMGLPFRTPGRTSVGQVSVEPNAIIVPDDLSRVKLYAGHSDAGGAPVGYLTACESTDAGMNFTFKVGSGSAGDQTLTAAAERVIDGMSVELVDLQRSGDGSRITRGVLSAVAMVAIPAFPNARASSVTASEQREVDMPATKNAAHQAAAEKTDGTAAAGENETAAAATTVAPAAPAVTAAQAPVGLTAAVARPTAPLTFSQVCDTLQAVRRNERSETLTAALADITRSANPYVSPDGWIGELWSGVAYQREIVPLLSTAPLTHWKITGWRWTEKPEVDDYAGNKAEIPTNEVTTESVSVEAKRLAGGHDIDRKFWDFNDQEFIRAYFSAMAEDYAYKSDQRAATFVTTSAATLPVGPVAPDLIRAAARGARYVKRNARSAATFVLVNDEDIESLLDFTQLDVPEYVKLLGIDPENFVPHEFVPKGKVIVGAKAAATFYELAGSPIRVETVDLARGGQDGALFGYYATLLHSKKGLVSVDWAAPKPAAG